MSSSHNAVAKWGQETLTGAKNAHATGVQTLEGKLSASEATIMELRASLESHNLQLVCFP